ncbi:MAG: hypothetical protein WC842_01380 [Candidatus Paceibacterota bacterium]|jgi:hypothetical protein
MRLYKNLFVIFFILIISGALFVPIFVGAQNINTTTLHLVFEPPCIANTGPLSFLGPCTPIEDIQTYIVRLYQFAVGISGIVAVGMIVYGAIIIIIKSENVSAKSEGRQIIQDALWGVLLLFASYLLLQSINPDLVKLKDPSAAPIATSTLTQGTLSQISSSTCGIATKIPAVEGVPIYSGDSTASPVIKADQDQEPYNKCGLRRVLFMHKGDINDNLSTDYETLDDLLSKTDGTTETKFFYNEGEILDKNTIVWTYPYYIKDTDPKQTARCVIYAIREPPPDAETKAETRLVDLNDGITPCLLDDIPTSTIKTTFGVELTEPVKQLKGWMWGNDPAKQTKNTDPNATDLVQIANQISDSYLDAFGDCAPTASTSPRGIMRDVREGKRPLVCYSGCKANTVPCSGDKGTLSLSLLFLIQTMQFDSEKGTLPQFKIESLTGGSHTSNNSNHYKGIAADVTTGSKTDTESILSYLKVKGVDSECEYYEGGKLIINKGTCAGYNSATHTGLHIHLNYP